MQFSMRILLLDLTPKPSELCAALLPPLMELGPSPARLSIKMLRIVRSDDPSTENPWTGQFLMLRFSITDPSVILTLMNVFGL